MNANIFLQKETKAAKLLNHRATQMNTDFKQTEEAEERHETARNFRKATGRFGAGKQGRKMEAETLSETTSFQPRTNANER